MNLIQEIIKLRGNTKGAFFILIFRISSFFTKNSFFKIIGLPIRIFYKFFVQWLLCIDIPDTVKLGRGFNLFHGQSTVIHQDSVIGRNVTLRHNTTIGNGKSEKDVPCIGNNVQIGANVVIIGKINIGDNAIIGAGSVVIKDVPSFSVVAGNPARVVKNLKI
ncbi:serine O-acetyltransferase [Adhaeribacter aquaticus]|uniref:serine O-acetyltransferase n=1 Tax=Adhaeribacter aquaticus TaxID=299567 RepID=UPI00047EAC7F|nr:serine acetyltransferase [Adhaeribacter aquaticus]